MTRASERLGRLGIAYERFAALPAPTWLRPREPNRHAGAFGCAASHRAILQRTLDLGRERVLIFEDDVVLRDDAGAWLERIVPQLRLVDWDVFYLGLHLAVSGPRRGDNLLAVARGYHTHAYAVAGKAIGRLIAHIDRILAAAAGTFDGMEDPSLLKVCAEPILAVQEPNLSRTCGRQMDRLEQYFTVFDGEDFRRHCREMAGWKHDST
jgi:GR25 family glycosyltransferase involved in LPS biosynthesis